MATVTKDQLKSLAAPRTEVVPVPELGPDMTLTVRGYTIGQTLEIQRMSTTRCPDGHVEIDAKQDVLLSFCAAVVEPVFTLEDTEWILNLPRSVIQRVLTTAERLSGRGQSDYDNLKDYLRSNTYVQRLYLAAAKLGKLPSDLADKPEEEFNTLLAAWELEAEREAEAMNEPE
jgi:hypothetical protein